MLVIGNVNCSDKNRHTRLLLRPCYCHQVYVTASNFSSAYNKVKCSERQPRVPYHSSQYFSQVQNFCTNLSLLPANKYTMRVEATAVIMHDSNPQLYQIFQKWPLLHHVCLEKLFQPYHTKTSWQVQKKAPQKQKCIQQGYGQFQCPDWAVDLTPFLLARGPSKQTITFNKVIKYSNIWLDINYGWVKRTTFSSAGIVHTDFIVILL
jgi:hypothetical protein